MQQNQEPSWRDYPHKERFPVRTCPECGVDYQYWPAISRTDNKTEICPDCGIQQARAAYVKYRLRNN